MLLAQLSFFVALAGCAQQGIGTAPPERAAPAGARRNQASSPIQHVVIIFQENRSVDNLFNGLPGADTVQSGKNSKGRTIPLEPISLKAPYDISHRHNAYNIEYAHGNLNGFNLVESHCRHRPQCPPTGLRAYGYVPQTEVQPYFTMAEAYTFADRMFQTNQGPSFPAHQYILSGTSTITANSNLRASENPVTPQGQQTGGCDSPKGTVGLLIDQYGNENQSVFPCLDRPALTDLIDGKSLTWRYYQAHFKDGLWNGPDAIQHIRNGPDYATDVVAPPYQIVPDIANGHLANVVWVTPTLKASDHAGNTNGSGPSWVALVVNAIGQSQYWNSTVIFVTWDDWGGWYDHVKPAQYNSYELGLRVPLIVISPYAKTHYVSHVQHEFGSILKFTEETFGLGSLGTTDVRSDDLSDCFNFGQAPQRFIPISAPLRAEYFLNQPPSTRGPDDDF
jgi:phospholipase C